VLERAAAPLRPQSFRRSKGLLRTKPKNCRETSSATPARTRRRPTARESSGCQASITTNTSSRIWCAGNRGPPKPAGRNNSRSSRAEERGARRISGEGRRTRIGRFPAQLSQSERAWAYAKWALARGESPDIVIAAIASHRRFEKYNPQYHAELTVKKALASLTAEQTWAASAELERT